jgi:hypothetical protein
MSYADHNVKSHVKSCDDGHDDAADHTNDNKGSDNDCSNRHDSGHDAGHEKSPVSASPIDGYILSHCKACDLPISARAEKSMTQKSSPDFGRRQGCVVRRILFDPFPLLCAAVCVVTGSIKTIRQGGELSLVLDQSTLRYVLRESDAGSILGHEEHPDPPESQFIKTYDGNGRSTLEPVENHVGFWVPKYAHLRRSFKKEHFVRKRLGNSPAPLYVGEQRPKYARNVTARCTKTRCPSRRQVMRLVQSFGYDHRAARAATFNSWAAVTEFATFALAHHLPVEKFKGSRPSQRRAVQAAEGTGKGYQPINDPHNFDVPMRRTKTGGGFEKEVVMAALRESRYSDAMTLGIFDVLYHRRSPKQVAEDRRIPYGTLRVYATRIKVAARQICTQ